MERGYITITENNAHEWNVEAKLINGTLWITKHEMARLFGVYVNTIGNNLRAIFKSGILHEQNVTHIHKYESKGKECYSVFYNLEALIFVSYRVASFQARAFREWVMNALCEYNRTDKKKSAEVVLVYNMAAPDNEIN